MYRGNHRIRRDRLIRAYEKADRMTYSQDVETYREGFDRREAIWKALVRLGTSLRRSGQ